MLCREIIAVCSEIYTKPNTLCGQNVGAVGELVWIFPQTLSSLVQTVPDF